MKTVGDTIFSSRPPSLRAYHLTYAALIGLLLLTYGLAKLEWGAWHTPTALVIATLKAGLVLAMFMGVRGGQKLIIMLFGGAMMLLAIAALLTMTDYVTRAP